MGIKDLLRRWVRRDRAAETQRAETKARIQKRLKDLVVEHGIKPEDQANVAAQIRDTIRRQTGLKAEEGFLLLILPPDIGDAEIVRSAAAEAGFSGGDVRVFHGPSEITRGRAEALLARVDTEHGTNFLSRPFRIGTGIAQGHSFAFVAVD